SYIKLDPGNWVQWYNLSGSHGFEGWNLERRGHISEAMQAYRAGVALGREFDPVVLAPNLVWPASAMAIIEADMGLPPSEEAQTRTRFAELAMRRDSAVSGLFSAGFSAFAERQIAY